jgi:hypothetical protein
MSALGGNNTKKLLFFEILAMVGNNTKDFVKLRNAGRQREPWGRTRVHRHLVSACV